MCGIAGFFNQGHDLSIKTLYAMVASLKNRGPDAEGYFFLAKERQVALGHRRLAILDRSEKANQPMQYENLIMIYNGEVYNFLAIKKELEKKGYSFLTHSDTEVILKAFHCWGLHSLQKLRGMFAFCIFDQVKQMAYLVRDRVGVKPLYFYYDTQHFIFASDPKSFLQHPHFKKEICNKGLQLFLQFGYVPAPFTIFKNTQKLCPAHYLEYDLNANTLCEKKYWDLADFYLCPKLQLDEEEAVTHLEQLFADSFCLRMISDVPVGVFLSGGIDSSLIAAILQKHHAAPLHTFTIGFSSRKYDESCYAKQIAKHLHTLHEERQCTVQDAQKILSEFPQIYSEPLADMSSIPTALLADFSRQKVTVALSGDGGDELFCGYPSYDLNLRRFNLINKLPFKKHLKKVLDCIPDPIFFFHYCNSHLYSRYLKLKSTLFDDTLEAQYQSVSRNFSVFEISKLLRQQSNFDYDINIFPKMNSLERMMLYDFLYYLPDDLLVKVDRATMYCSLEGREPFLDHQILEFAAQLPMKYKLNKFILKKLLGKYVPSVLFERRKQGFGVPINQWLRKELVFFLHRYFDPIKIKRQNIFNHQYVDILFRTFLKGKLDDNRIWTLLVFQMWFETYFQEYF